MLPYLELHLKNVHNNNNFFVYKCCATHYLSPNKCQPKKGETTKKISFVQLVSDSISFYSSIVVSFIFNYHVVHITFATCRFMKKCSNTVLFFFAYSFGFNCFFAKVADLTLFSLLHSHITRLIISAPALGVFCCICCVLRRNQEKKQHLCIHCPEYDILLFKGLACRYNVEASLRIDREVTFCALSSGHKKQRIKAIPHCLLRIVMTKCLLANIINDSFVLRIDHATQ